MSGRSLKVNYILNHYSSRDSTHFAHVLALLQEMSLQGGRINLFVEKHEGEGPSIHGVQVHMLRCQKPVLRHIELFFRLAVAVRQGYRSTFIRITAPAAIVASVCHALLGGRAFLWQSGATHEFDWSRPWGVGKLKWIAGSAFPNFLARSLCQRFVTGPEAMVDYYANVVGIERKKIRLLYNDIDLTRWKQHDPVKRSERFFDHFGAEKPKHVLLLVHRLSPVRKTPMYLEPLFKELVRSFGSDWLLLVAGNGGELFVAEKMAKDAGVVECCRFLGAVPNKELPELYGLSDVFLNPSHAEGFPRVVIEAMASGLPIVTTDAGGTEQLFGSMQAAWVVNKDEPGQFASRVVSLLKNEGEMARLSQENLMVVSRYSTPTVAGMYAHVLGE